MLDHHHQTHFPSAGVWNKVVSLILPSLPFSSRCCFHVPSCHLKTACFFTQELMAGCLTLHGSSRKDQGNIRSWIEIGAPLRWRCCSDITDSQGYKEQYGTSLLRISPHHHPQETNIIGQDVSKAPNISGGDLTFWKKLKFILCQRSLSSFWLGAELSKRIWKAATTMAKRSKGSCMGK